MSKFTKGKWRVIHELNVYSNEDRFICSCGLNSTINNAKIYEENKANATLIASAPELLEACKKYELACKKAREGKGFSNDIDALKAIVEASKLGEQAIAKAEGK